MALLEFHQDIHVAVRTEIVTEDRPEQGEFPDVMPSAKSGNRLAINGNCRRHMSWSFD